MRILIPPSHIIGELAATSKRGVLAEMTRLLPEFDHDILETALLDREAVGATAIDPGIAVPHAKVEGADDILVCFARSKAGIQWGAPDRQLVHLIFLLVAPVSASVRYLQVLAALCRVLRDSRQRRQLLVASEEELFEILATAKELQ